MKALKIGLSVVLTLAFVVAVIAYPLDATGRPPLGITNFDSVHLSDTGGTAVPVLKVNQKGTGKVVEFLDSGTPVWSLNDGGGLIYTGSQEYLNISAPTAIATTQPALKVNNAGVSNQFELQEAATPIALVQGWGAVTVTTTTTKHIWEIVDTSPVMTAGTNIYSALNLDLAIGNSTAGTNEVDGILIDGISGDAQVTENAIKLGAGWDVGIDAGALTILNIGATGTDFSATGGLTLADALTITSGGASLSDGDMVVADDLRVTAQTSLTVTDATAFTPTGTYQNITAAGTVTPTIAAGATAGDLLVLINTSAQVINIADSGTAKLSAAAALNQFDVLILWSDGTNWIEISRSDN